MTKLIPADTKLAAKRGFVRTASQSLATSLVLPAGVTFAFTQDALTSAAVGVGTMIVGAVVNGAQSYFSILSKGIPGDYEALDHVDEVAGLDEEAFEEEGFETGFGEEEPGE